MNVLEGLQGVLSFQNCTSINFSRNGMGKIGTTGFVLGAVGGVHFGIFCTISALLAGGVNFGSSPIVAAVVSVLL